MSSLKLSWHLAATEMWFLDAVIDHVFREDDSPMPSEPKPGADIARWYDENFAQRLPRLEALSGEHLATPVDYIGLLNDPAVAYLSFGIRHSVHHRGQLSAYLRPMGAKVPAIYVESADEPFPPATHSPALSLSAGQARRRLPRLSRTFLHNFGKGSSSKSRGGRYRKDRRFLRLGGM